MQSLDKTRRNQLDRTIRKARPVAEEAAQAGLEQLGVGETRVPDYLNESQRKLRQRLRAHARSLGDPLVDGAQAITRLTGEIAYEHWHRMLFARFLAENDLLMYEGVAITLEECDELAEEEGFASGWELAAQQASRMLPQVFRIDSPVFELTLAAEYQRELESLLADLDPSVFQASDSLGWVYQFWQTDNKERINLSEVKIGADELPAVTQLFTEPYMVSFLLDNSLGAWWAARHLSETDLASAENEQELRDKASLPGVPLEYLRFVRDEETSHWTPAAGTFDAWPQNLAELKTLDPCCGSGHFLVAALLMLVPMRMELDGLSARDAVDAVLRENLHGLEIDQRCVELAAFALALTAWRYPDAGGYRSLPELHLACSGLAINAKKSEWLDLAGNDTNLGIALEKLYKQFRDAPILGSLINPEASLDNETLFKQKWEEVGPIISKVLADERDEERSEVSVVAKGVAKSAILLSQKYDLALTNVPYLGISKHHPRLMEFIEKHYSTGKYDLAMAFIERIREWIKPNGSYAVVSLGEWLYLGPYMQYRENYLKKHKPLLVLRLGWNAFSTPIRANPALIISQAGNEKESPFSLSDYSANKKIQDNVRSTTSGSISQVDIAQIRKNPDMRFINPESSERDLLVKFSDARSGLHAGDLYQFFKMFWEVEKLDWIWEPVQTAVNETANFSGREQIIRWENENGTLAALAESVNHLNHAAQNWRAGKPFWGKHGIVVGLMGKAACAIYSGQRYDVNSSAVIPKNKSNLPALWVFCESGDFSKQVRLLDNSLKLAPKTLLKVSFDLDHWTKVAEQKYPHGLPEPYTDDPTQWIFHGHPCGSVIWDEEAKWTAHGPLRTDDTVLQVAVARLLGYRWPAELDPKMELAGEQREWVKRCEALLPYADRDGIVCLPAVRGERRAVDRLEALLAEAYGEQWSATTRAKLLESVDHAGKDLDSWLRDKFFTQHCKLFQNRPFIWHVWDGLKDGFSALVNYHKLDYKALETLTYTYLGDWINAQSRAQKDGVDGAGEKLAAAQALQKSLELILEGKDPYDIFVRWKPLEEQPIGWTPDLNDGVRLNIRPFVRVDDVKVKDAGILRDRVTTRDPKTKQLKLWKKDRGKDVESAPWYNLGPNVGGAKGDRINDYHLTLAAKKAARKQAEGG